jgi:hypothetical protein
VYNSVNITAFNECIVVSSTGTANPDVKSQFAKSATLNMAQLPRYLVSMVTSHLTDTETRFLHCSYNHSNIDWDELFMSESLYRYGIKHHMLSTSFLAFVLKTAPYDVFILLANLQQLQCWMPIPTLEASIHAVIYWHRPLPILALMLQLYNTATNNKREWCAFAASSNNPAALEWLRNPDTGDGRCFWSKWTCATAAEYGRIDMLERLRNPNLDGGVCPWDTCACLHAVRAGHLETLIWLRNPEKGGGVCPWHKAGCLSTARFYNHVAMAAWIEAQPDDL